MRKRNPHRPFENFNRALVAAAVTGLISGVVFKLSLDYLSYIGLNIQVQPGAFDNGLTMDSILTSLTASLAVGVLMIISYLFIFISLVLSSIVALFILRLAKIEHSGKIIFVSFLFFLLLATLSAMLLVWPIAPSQMILYIILFPAVYIASVFTVRFVITRQKNRINKHKNTPSNIT